MNPGNIPDTKTTGPVQTTPHTESQQNRDAAQSDLAPNLNRADAGRGDDASSYVDRDGAQTATDRSFARNESRGPQHNTEPFTAAGDNPNATRTPHSDNQGITNHSANIEDEGQRKVVSERPDSLAGVSQGDKA